jgi:UDPglucose 6-dehydrogenase
VTEWDEFRKLKPEDFIRFMKIPAVVDGRRMYDPEVYSRKLKFKAVGLSF